jgi:predicted dehydrogenase
MGMTDIRAGVVGVGFIGVAHVEAIRRLGVAVAEVVGSSPERARAKAETAGLPAVYESVEAMAADDSIETRP